jgi:RNA polymerase sigma-70 factor (ECF subfamily)
MTFREQMIAEMESPALRERLVLTVMAHSKIDRGDAEDAVQDGYLQALKTKFPWDGRCALSTWLTRVVINASRMRYRSRSCVEKHEVTVDTMYELPGNQSPYRHTLHAERVSYFILAISKLSPCERRAILLRVQGDDTQAALARRDGVSTAAAKSRLSRARSGVRETLAGIL